MAFVPRAVSLFDKATGCKLFCMDCPTLFTSCPRNLNTTQNHRTHARQPTGNAFESPSPRIDATATAARNHEQAGKNVKTDPLPLSKQPTLANRATRQERCGGPTCLQPKNIK